MTSLLTETAHFMLTAPAVETLFYSLNSNITGTTLDSEYTFERCLEEAQLEYQLTGARYETPQDSLVTGSEPCLLSEGYDTPIRRLILKQLALRASSFTELHSELVKQVLHVNVRKKTLGYLVMKLKKARTILQIGPFYRFNPSSELGWELLLVHHNCFASDEPLIYHETALNLLQIEDSLQRVVRFLVTPFKPSGNVKSGKIAGLSLFLIEYLYEVKQREYEAITKLFGHLVKEEKSILHFLRALERLGLVKSITINGQLTWKIEDNDDVKVLYHAARLHERDLWNHTMGRSFIIRRLCCYEQILETRNSALMTDFLLEKRNDLLDLIDHLKRCFSIGSREKE